MNPQQKQRLVRAAHFFVGTSQQEQAKVERKYEAATIVVPAA